MKKIEIPKTLKPEYQDLADEWDILYGDDNCYCCATPMPPCTFCEGSGTHDGHPEHLENNEDAWEITLENAVRYFNE